MQGERSQEETVKLEADIKKKTVELERHIEDKKLLSDSNKQLQDERRNIERVIQKVEK